MTSPMAPRAPKAADESDPDRVVRPEKDPPARFRAALRFRV